MADGQFGAVAQQYPSRMGDMGVRAIVDHLRDGTKPTTSPGLDFLNTGIQLVTNQNVTGVESIPADQGLKLCW